MFEEITGVKNENIYCSECSDIIGNDEDMIEYDGKYYHYECFEENVIQILKYDGIIKTNIRARK